MKWHRQFWEEPQAQAEFDYWTKMPAWSLEEIVALSLGKDPRYVSSDKFVHGTRGTEFSTAYFTLLDAIQRHYAEGELSENTRPTKVIGWAEEFNFPMPEELVERIQQLEQKRMKKRKAQVWTIAASNNEEGAKAPQPLPDHITESKNSPPGPVNTTDHLIQASALPSASMELEILDPDEQPLHPKNRKTLLTLIGAMVLKSYRHKNGSDLGTLTHTLETQLTALGVPMHKDTIRNCVRSGLAMLEENQSKRK